MHKIKAILAVMFALVVCSATAQDVIVKRNGDEIEAKVLTITDNDVSYKKWSNQEGPTYTTSIGDIFMIKYSNGDKDVFEAKDTDKNTNQSNINGGEGNNDPSLIEKAPAANNKELIDRYNAEVKVIQEKTGKDAKYYLPILAVSESSILSNEDIEISIIPTIVYDFSYGTNVYLQYYIEFKNKTNNTIYIDKANTFRVSENGKYYAYYNAQQTNITSGNTIGVGGTLSSSIAVGGSSQNMVTDSYIEQRILAIPPYAKANLTEFEQRHIKGNRWKTISDIEYYDLGEISKRGFIKEGESDFYDEDNTPYSKKYHITYSKGQNFSSYSILQFKLYVYRIVGVEDSTSAMIPSKDKYIKKMKKYIPDFYDNPNYIIGEIGILVKD